MSAGSFASRVVATKVVATDGTGDFTDIQAAIDDLPSGGGVVYIKEGTYTITTKISITIDNVSLIGAGRATEIKTTTNIIVIHVFDADNFIASEFRITGSGATNTSNVGIRFENGTNCMVKDCWIENCGDVGLEAIGNASRIFFIGNRIDNCEDHQIVSVGLNAIITNNIVINGSAAGMLLGGSRDICMGNQIVDNDGDGIISEDGNQNIIGNVVIDNGGDGLAMGENQSSTNNVISGNNVIANGGTGILLFAGADRCNVHGNIVRNNTTAQITDNGTNNVLADNITT